MKEALLDFQRALDLSPAAASKEVRRAICKLRQELGAENQQLCGRACSAESVAGKLCDEDAIEVLSKYSNKS